MDYLTQYYKNKTEELQERYGILATKLLFVIEDQSNLTDAQIEDWIKGNAQNEEQAKNMRELLKRRRARDLGNQNPKKDYSSIKQTNQTSKTPKTGAPNGGAAKTGAAKTGAPNGGAPNGGTGKTTSSTSSSGEPPIYPESPSKTGTSNVKPTEPPVHPKAASTKSSAKTGSVKGGFAKGAAGFGAGVGVAIPVDMATRTALSAAGVENEEAHDLTAAFTSGAAGGAADVAATSALSGAGMGSSIAAGLRAATPIGLATVAGTALGKYVVKPLADITYKLPGEKGNAKSTIDRYGEGMYNASPIVRGITNLIAGNKLTAGSGDLNEKPKGVAGGDPTLKAKWDAEEAAEQQEKEAKIAADETQKAERAKGRADRIAAKVAEIKAKANQQ